MLALQMGFGWKLVSHSQITTPSIVQLRLGFVIEKVEGVVVWPFEIREYKLHLLVSDSYGWKYLCKYVHAKPLTVDH